MGLVLFDWETDRSFKKDIKALLSIVCLFDGYLTEIKSYQQLQKKILFDWKISRTTKKAVRSVLSKVCLFDGYLTEIKSYQQLRKYKLRMAMIKRYNSTSWKK